MDGSWRFRADELIRTALGAYKEGVDVPHGLEDLLDLLYRVSLQTEEGHQILLSCVVLRQGATFPLNAHFEEPLRATPDRLRKFALGTDPQSTVMVLRADSSDGNVRILGLASRLVARTFMGTHTKSLCMAAIRGVAELHFVHPDGEGLFLRDRYDQPTGTSRMSTWLPRHYEDSLVNDVMRECEHQRAALPVHQTTREPTPMPTDPKGYIRLELAKVIRALATRMRTLGNGGSVLLLPVNHEQLGELTTSYHSLRSAETGALGLEWSGCILESVALGMLQPSGGPPSDELMDAYRRAANASEEEIRRTAQLTLIDGALVLNERFEPIGLGAKLRMDNEPYLPDLARGYLQAREKGTRHRSMACAVHRCRIALGIVASSDGEITLITKSIAGDIAIHELIV